MKSTVTRSTFFLTELILDLFIFIICASVCVSILVRAYGMSQDSARLTESVYIAQTVAERYRTGEDAGGFYRADGTKCAEEWEYLNADYFVALIDAKQATGDLLPAVLVQVFPADGGRDEPCYTLTVKSLQGVTP